MTAQFDWSFPYRSTRYPVVAANMVATSQPLAAQTGLNAMRRGGNAIDAAVATAIALTVVEPVANGLGGDLFALVWDGKQLHGLNASGRSPQALTPDVFKGQVSIPPKGWQAVTVPGQVSGWVALNEKFGRLPFSELFDDAITYARCGFPVPFVIADRWKAAETAYKDFPDFGKTFLPGGKAPTAGETFRNSELAHSLELIAQSNGREFYHGKLAEAIAAHAKTTCGFITQDDLATHQADWVMPIATDYHGLVLHEIPPNGQGIAALLALGIARHLKLDQFPVDGADWQHLQIEAMKLALADTHRHVADPAAMRVKTGDLLDDDYLASRAKLINRTRAQHFDAGIPQRGGTVLLISADDDGNMVSLIQSNYQGFGSGIVIPGTGISMQNRAIGFSLDPAHPNCLVGGKRPFHTILPGFVTRGGKPWMAFGVMGGPMQPQGHFQLLLRMADHRQNPQAACDAPRWQFMRDMTVAVEKEFPADVVQELARRGHTIETQPTIAFGGAQMICALDTGYLGASDWRKDGHAAGF